MTDMLGTQLYREEHCWRLFHSIECYAVERCGLHQRFHSTYFYLISNSLSFIVCMYVVVDIGFEMQAYTIAEDGGSVEVCVIMLGATERSINFTVEAQSSSASNLYTLKLIILPTEEVFYPRGKFSTNGRSYKNFMSHSLIYLMLASIAVISL